MFRKIFIFLLFTPAVVNCMKNEDVLSRTSDSYPIAYRATLLTEVFYDKVPTDLTELESKLIKIAVNSKAVPIKFNLDILNAKQLTATLTLKEDSEFPCSISISYFFHMDWTDVEIRSHGGVNPYKLMEEFRKEFFGYSSNGDEVPPIK